MPEADRQAQEQGGDRAPRALQPDVLEELFFAGLIGNVQIDSVVPYILKMETSEYQAQFGGGRNCFCALATDVFFNSVHTRSQAVIAPKTAAASRRRPTPTTETRRPPTPTTSPRPTAGTTPPPPPPWTPPRLLRGPRPPPAKKKGTSLQRRRRPLLMSSRRRKRKRLLRGLLRCRPKRGKQLRKSGLQRNISSKVHHQSYFLNTMCTTTLLHLSPPPQLSGAQNARERRTKKKNSFELRNVFFPRLFGLARAAPRSVLLNGGNCDSK